MTGADGSAAVEMVALSDRGRVRERNEDAVFVDAGRGLAVLADGLGGHRAGAVASNMAVAVLGSELPQSFVLSLRGPTPGDIAASARETMMGAVIRTNAVIHHAAGENPKYAGMGTTLVAAQFYADRLLVAHVGDSRLYRWRAGVLAQLTRDHTRLQCQIDKGMLEVGQGRPATNRNLLTRALGVDAIVRPEIGDHAVQAGDIYLLCSDGLTGMADDEQIAAVMNRHGGDMRQSAAQLVEKANELGGKDNVSVILAKITAPQWQTMTS